MSNVNVVHTDHIKPANLKELIADTLKLSSKLMATDAEAGDGWILVNAAQALRKYNDILEAAYTQSLREGYDGSHNVSQMFNIGDRK